jgi:hypothetical protein
VYPGALHGTLSQQESASEQLWLGSAQIPGVEGTSVAASPAGAMPPSPVGGWMTGGLPHKPVGCPGVMLQVRPAQQSLVDVQTPAEGTHTTSPPSGRFMQRSWPSAPGTQGTPPQHSAEKVQTSSPWMQQGSWPV